MASEARSLLSEIATWVRYTATYMRQVLKQNHFFLWR